MHGYQVFLDSLGFHFNIFICKNIKKKNYRNCYLAKIIESNYTNYTFEINIDGKTIKQIGVKTKQYSEVHPSCLCNSLNLDFNKGEA